MRTPVSLALRISEGVLVYLMYMKYNVASSSLVAASWAFTWNGACVLLAFLLDRNHRKLFGEVKTAERLRAQQRK